MNSYHYWSLEVSITYYGYIFTGNDGKDDKIYCLQNIVEMNKSSKSFVNGFIYFLRFLKDNKPKTILII